MEDKVIMKLRFTGVLPMESKTIHDGEIMFRLTDSQGHTNYLQSRDVEFDQECEILPLDDTGEEIEREVSRITFNQFETISVAGRTYAPLKMNISYNAQEEINSLKVKVFELEQEIETLNIQKHVSK